MSRLAYQLLLHTFRLESRDWRGPKTSISKSLGGSFGGSFGSLGSGIGSVGGNGSVEDEDDGTGSGSFGIAGPTLTLGRSLR